MPMDTVRLAYRDNDRTPVIYCIKEMAARHYDLNVDIMRVHDNDAYEQGVFDGSFDMICEHLEYLFQEVAQRGKKATMFLAPVGETQEPLVVAPDIARVSDLEGKKIAVRTTGRPFAITLRVRQLGLEGKV